MVNSLIKLTKRYKDYIAKDIRSFTHFIEIRKVNNTNSIDGGKMNNPLNCC